MAFSTAALERLGLRVRPEEFARLVEEALADIFPPRRDTSPRQALTPEEVRALEEGGAVLEPRAHGAESPLVRTAAEYAALLADGEAGRQAAECLGVDASRVRQRLAAHTLYGIKQPSGWRLPRFQFTERGLVPGFERIAPRLIGVDPVSVARWFTGPHLDLTLEDDDTPIAPRTWLELGLDPGVVTALADELHGGA